MFRVPPFLFKRGSSFGGSHSCSSALFASINSFSRSAILISPGFGRARSVTNINSVLCRNLTRPAILAGFHLHSERSPQPSSLWKCGNPRCVRVSKRPGQGLEIPVWSRNGFPGASFPQRSQQFCPFRWCWDKTVDGLCATTDSRNTFKLYQVASPLRHRWEGWTGAILSGYSVYSTSLSE